MLVARHDDDDDDNKFQLVLFHSLFISFATHSGIEIIKDKCY